MRKTFLLLSFILSLAVLPASAQQRSLQTLDKDWYFIRQDVPNAHQTQLDTKEWETVSVPHDWAIAGPFDRDVDMQVVKVEQDMDTEARLRTGRTGALPHIGVGWYRKTFKVPAYQEGKKVLLTFDGAMSDAHVWVNGEKVGNWPYGYSYFYFDITDYLKPGQENLLAVRLENQPESSRWYPGAGLFRKVQVLVKDEVSFDHWKTFITTPLVAAEQAQVNIKTEVTGNNLRLEAEVIAPDGKVVARETSSQQFGKKMELNLGVAHPQLWDLDHPHLYHARLRLYQNDELRDEETVRFGIRSVVYERGKGLVLNGRVVKFKGVCLHHDLGPLGAAVNEAAIRRQIRTMQDMGANAIRTSHNMPAPEFVRIADEMGMMLMVESFDEWTIPKVKNGYNRYFKSWAERDLVNLLHHYRNNPSVVMWCIGNEVEEQSHKHGSRVARFLQDICHREDPTRPVTNGMDRPDQVLSNHMAAMMERSEERRVGK